jgi:hypothetical protein
MTSHVPKFRNHMEEIRFVTEELRKFNEAELEKRAREKNSQYNEVDASSVKDDPILPS